MKLNIDDFYREIFCAFDYWDVPLSGLILRDEKYLFFELINAYNSLADDDPPVYQVSEIDWDEECEEYLQDYVVAYKHWLYKDGKRPYGYEGWSLEWFSEKWKHRKPIKEKIVHDSP